MIRVQVQLTEEQAEALRRQAAQRRTSVARLVRDAVDASLREGRSSAQWDRALAVLGRFGSGASDVSVEHDRYLDDAFAP